MAFAKSVYRAYFADNVDITDAKEVAIAAASQGIDPAELLAVLGSEEVRQMLRQENDRALARGVFGSPFFIVGEEQFWGVDRLHQVERWLQSGGW